MNEYKFDEIEVGHQESFDVEITEEKMQMFRSITGDVNPLHNDETYAAEAGFGERVGYGMLTASFLSTLAGVYLPGKYSLIYTTEVDFVKPTHIGDKLTITGIVSEKNEVFRYLWLKITIKNSNGEKICRAKMRVGVLK